MSDDDWEKLTDPYAGIEGGHDFPDTSGTVCVSVGGADNAGLVYAAGAGMLPPAWGAEDDPDREKVDNWTEVADLGSSVPGVLNAAIWGGRLWLKITESAITPTESVDDWSALTEAPMTQPICAVAESGLPTSNSRPVYPGWSVCPKADAESLLKTSGGQWRGDVEWCPLCSFQVYKGDPSVQSPWWVTLWLVVVGDTLVFWKTESVLGETGSDWRRLNSYEQTGREDFTPADWRNLDMNPISEFKSATALTPWQLDDTEPALAPENDWSETLGSIGNLNALSEEYVGVPPLSPPLRLCSMSHCTQQDGVLLYLNSYDPPQESPADMVIVRTLFEQGYMYEGEHNQTMIYRQPWAYLYDPQAANGRGYYQYASALSALGVVKFDIGRPVLEDNRLATSHCTEGWVRDGLNWGEWAEPLRTVCSWETDTAHGYLCIIIGGTEINDTLCTASCFGVRWFEL